MLIKQFYVTNAIIQCKDLRIDVDKIYNDVLIVIVKGYDYRIYFCDMCKDEAMNKMENANLNEKIGLTD